MKVFRETQTFFIETLIVLTDDQEILFCKTWKLLSVMFKLTFENHMKKKENTELILLIKNFGIVFTHSLCPTLNTVVQTRLIWSSRTAARFIWQRFYYQTSLYNLNIVEWLTRWPYLKKPSPTLSTLPLNSALSVHFQLVRHKRHNSQLSVRAVLFFFPTNQFSVNFPLV